MTEHDQRRAALSRLAQDLVDLADALDNPEEPIGTHTKLNAQAVRLVADRLDVYADQWTREDTSRNHATVCLSDIYSGRNSK